MGYVGRDTKTPWLIVDFETTAREDIDQFADSMKVDRRLVDPVKIAEAKAKKIEMAATDIDYARIVCTGIWDSNDPQPYAFTIDQGSDETAQLIAFWAAYRLIVDAGGIVMGFNHLTYDLPLAMRRSQLLGVSFPRVDLYKYQKGPIVDLLGRMTFDWTVDRDKWKSLAVYCQVFGIDIPDATSGRDMPALIAAGEWDAVRAHNLADLRRTQALAQRLGVIGPPAAEAAA